MTPWHRAGLTLGDVTAMSRHSPLSGFTPWVECSHDRSGWTEGRPGTVSAARRAVRVSWGAQEAAMASSVSVMCLRSSSRRTSRMIGAISVLLLIISRRPLLPGPCTKLCRTRV